MIYFTSDLHGENNPNYGNRWSDELKEKVSHIVKQRYIDENHLTLEELFIRIINYKKEWYEQDLVIKLIEDYKNGKRWINKYRKE